MMDDDLDHEDDDFDPGDDTGHKIKPEPIDELRDTWITVGCYRETWRLDRMLLVYQKAMTLARKNGDDAELSALLVSLHDRKGQLTATWRQTPSGAMQSYLATAWDDQCEFGDTIKHRLESDDD